MAAVFKKESLSYAEAETYTELEKKGVKICGVPMEIEHNDQLKSMHITTDDVGDMTVGITKIRVHFTPGTEQDAKAAFKHLNDKYSKEYRENRCDIPGTRKPLIRCPERNKCWDCPHPEIKAQHEAREASLEVMMKEGYDHASDVNVERQVLVKTTLDIIKKEICSYDPDSWKIIELNKKDGYTAEEIVKILNLKDESVVYDKIRKIVDHFKNRKDQYL